jgi:hypothetical protein
LGRVAFCATPTQNPAIISWYTQIGTWHHHKDSLGGKSYIFHDAGIDGLASGEATSNIRLNRGFENLGEFTGRLCLGPAPACAGLLVKNKKISCYFLIEKEKSGNFLKINRREKTEVAELFSFPVSVADTFELRLVLTKDSLNLVAGKITASVKRPVDLAGKLWIGFECVQGTIKVFGAEAASDAGVFKETFKTPTLMNLHLEKMFSSKKN